MQLYAALLEFIMVKLKFEESSFLTTFVYTKINGTYLPWEASRKIYGLEPELWIKRS